MCHWPHRARGGEERSGTRIGIRRENQSHPSFGLTDLGCTPTEMPSQSDNTKSEYIAKPGSQDEENWVVGMLGIGDYDVHGISAK